MDFKAIRVGLAAIPFNAHVGLEAGEVQPGRAVVHLPEASHLTNHIGSQHGSAVFAAAEAASGAAIYAAFADHMEGLVPLAEGGEIRFTKRAEGPLRAEAIVNGEAERLLELLQRQGRVRFDVAVNVTNGARDSVATARFHWYVRPSARR